MTIKAWNKWMAALLALAFALVCLPALADGFAADIKLESSSIPFVWGRK